MTMKAKFFHTDVPCVDQVTKRQTRSSEILYERLWNIAKVVKQCFTICFG